MRHLGILSVLLFGMTLSSCFKDEPLNAECDIEEAYLHADDPATMFYQPSDSLVRVISSENTIRFSVREGVDITKLAPMFRTTEGATISPESGSEHDFSKGPVTYTVTSQDGEWTRTYQVRVNIKQRTIDEIDVFGFEDVYLEKDKNKYYVWNDVTADGYELDDWATGNPGFALSRGTAKPDEYPSVTIEDGYQGKGVKLTTLSTGALGGLVRMPIAAGNLFIGNFDVLSALTNAMEATHFGKPVARRPLHFSGYYKYQPGATVTDRNQNVVAGAVDKGDIYAVLYKNTDDSGNAIVLKGDNVKTSDRIVAIAQPDEVKTTGQWTAFDIAFSYSADLDPDILERYGYSLAIVCTSSTKGASFEGAIGSTLWVDELKITWE